MLKILAISSYRSLLNVLLPLGELNVISGANGSGKSNIYRALRLLTESANGRLIGCLAAEGGLPSALWAGSEARSATSPEPISMDSMRRSPIRLQMGFSSDAFTYSIDLGLASPSNSAFSLDPIIKRECVWRGDKQNASSLIADRNNSIFRCRDRDGKWMEVTSRMATHDGLLSSYADPIGTPELVLLREMMQRWRFYDHLRTDVLAPARQIQIGTYAPSLADDGSNLAAALQAIRESGRSDQLDEAIEDAFPGSQLLIESIQGRFEVRMSQPSMRRSIGVAELSEGTLRYLMLCAALLSARAPELIVLNEPESHLHPQLLPSLAKLIANCSADSQVIVVTHSQELATALGERNNCFCYKLLKVNGSTRVHGQDPLEVPIWKWPSR
jgi:predicted ATPase